MAFWSTKKKNSSKDDTASISNNAAITPHSPPVLDESGAVPVFRIPEEGKEKYFPTGSKAVDALVSVPATLFQMHPDFFKEQQHKTNITKNDIPTAAPADAAAGSDNNTQAASLPPLLASGILTLRDPSAGTASEVALIGECNGTVCFYVLADDATVKLSPTDFVLMLPKDCICVSLDDNTDPKTLLHFEALLAARTKFCDQATDVAVTSGSIRTAKGLRVVSEKTCYVAETVSGKIASAVGKSVGKHVVVKDTDSGSKRKARELLLASSLAYAEVADGMGTSYDKMVRSAKNQAVGYVAKKYGEEAAELARHTAGAAANFGSAALTARRVLDVKKVVKSSAKQALKEGIKGTIRGR